MLAGFRFQCRHVPQCLSGVVVSGDDSGLPGSDDMRGILAASRERKQPDTVPGCGFQDGVNRREQLVPAAGWWHVGEYRPQELQVVASHFIAAVRSTIIRTASGVNQ